jgi:hypothetical protein
MPRFIAKIFHLPGELKCRQVRGLFWLVLPIGVIMLSFSGWLVLAENGQELWEERVRPVEGPDGRRYLTLNTEAMAGLLAQVRPEDAGEDQVDLPLPLPDGSTVRFLIAESAVLEPALAAKYPEIRTYAGRAIDDPATTMRGLMTPQGFEAIVFKTDRLISLHRERTVSGQETGAGYYVSSDEQMAQADIPPVRCEVRDDGVTAIPDLLREENLAGRVVSIGGSLRTYRIALGATWEYAERFGGGTVAGTVAAMAGLLNRANGIYERELAIRFQLVDAPSLIYSTAQGFNAGSDPFTYGNSDGNLRQFAPLLAGFGRERFDLAHLLGWGGSGLAYPATACQDADLFGGPRKGLATSNISEDIGEQGMLSLFVHELGHQLGARHSFNGMAGYCGARDERVADSAVEPGSGSTVMSYAGLCDADNTAGYASGSLRFHFGSIEQILGYLNGGGACFQAVASANRPPVVDGGSDYTIPRLTPFELRAAGFDPDEGDLLTYVWDQVDVGGQFANPPYSDRDDPPGTTRPIFRSYEPERSGTRLFPRRDYILNHANSAPESVGGYRTAESLPAVGRVLNFGVMLRDNRRGGSGLSLDRVQLTVADNAGPFSVAEPNGGGEWIAGLQQRVSWQVANTNSYPVNCQQVRLTLSLDGGQTFPIVLEEATPNDGEAIVRLSPELETEAARLRVSAVGNIFFDISDAGFTIARNRIQVPGRNRSGGSGVPPRPVR